MTHWTFLGGLGGLGVGLSLAAPSPAATAESSPPEPPATAERSPPEGWLTVPEPPSASPTAMAETGAAEERIAAPEPAAASSTARVEAAGEADTDVPAEADTDVPANADTDAGPFAPDGTIRPIYRREDEFSAADLRRPSALTLETRSGRAERPAGVRRRHFRGVTIGVGGRVVVGRYQADPFSEPSGEPLGYGAAGTPVVDVLAEFGSRRLRFVIGTMSAPVPIGFSDYWTSTIFGVRAGVLAGNERFRFGATAGGGIWFTWEIMAHAFITPWCDRRGNRHGIGVDAGVWLFYPALSLSYRVAPAAWNHIGGRRAAKDRARASLP